MVESNMLWEGVNVCCTQIGISRSLRVIGYRPAWGIPQVSKSRGLPLMHVTGHCLEQYWVSRVSDLPYRARI